MSRRVTFDSISHGLEVVGNAAFQKHPVLGLPLTSIMRTEFALTLQHLMQIYTVGSFLTAWRDPKNHRSIEQIFDSPQQARHAAAVCATWLGVQVRPAHETAAAWWVGDEHAQLDA